MSPNPTDLMPPGTVAAILESVAASRYPRQDKPTIASGFGITIADLQVLLNHHGGNDQDPQRLRTAAAELRARDLEQPEPAADVSRETPEQEPQAVATPASPSQRLVRVRVDDLHADPNNPREHLAHKIPEDERHHSDSARDDIDQLADSIRESGLLQPIVVREAHLGDRKVLVIVAGHRRAAALRRLRWTTTEVLVRPPMRPDDVLAAMLIENGQRAGLDPIEEARAIKRLGITHGWTDAQVARKIGRSQSYVSMRLALLNLDPADQERVRSGQMGRTAGSALGRQNSGKIRNSAKGNITLDYFGPTNELATRARARCERAHRAGTKPRKIAGGEACGACWESVIRADERDHLQTVNATADACVTCGEPIDPDRPTP